MAEKMELQTASRESVAYELTRAIVRHEKRPEGVSYKDWVLDVFDESLDATYGRRNID